MSPAIPKVAINRETWLNIAVDKLRKGLFKQHALIPDVKVSIGWPSVGGTRSKNKRIGEHWTPKATSDQVSQIYISPLLDDPVEYLDVLCHELIHAIYPTDGHGRLFGSLARAIGLEGPLTKTVAGSGLRSTLATLADDIGEFPHAKINLRDRKKQTTRLVKVECESCEYVARVSRTQLLRGHPFCGVCKGVMK